MSIFDESRAIESMMKNRHLSREEIAKMMGVSRSCVSNKLRLLAFDEDEQRKITEAGLTERHARALLRLTDKAERTKLLNRICKEKPSVAATESLVDLAHTAEAPLRIGNAKKLEAVKCFTDSLRESINALRSLEIDAKQTINYYGDKLYITLSISEK